MFGLTTTNITYCSAYIWVWLLTRANHVQGCTWDSLTNRFLPHTPYTCLILYNHVMCFWTMNMALFLLFMYRELLPMFTLTWKSRVLVSILDFMIPILNYLTAISLSHTSIQTISCKNHHYNHLTLSIYVEGYSLKPSKNFNIH